MDDSNCKPVRAALWDYTAGTLARDERAGVEAHLDECRECWLHRSEVRSLRSGLKNLPKRSLSPLLETRLRVISSRERSRRMLRRDVAARLKEIGSRAKLAFDNLLRPLAVPAAGGLLASCLCFGMIVDTLQVHRDWSPDIPVGLFTQVTMDDVSPFNCLGKDIIVQLTVDETGQVSDFMVPQGAASGEELQEIGNLVLYSTFKPATAFGQRVAGKILVSIHHINIRG